MRWEDAPKFDGRPIAYSAAGSHGLWATPGSHVYANVSFFFSSFTLDVGIFGLNNHHSQALNIFKLIDETDDVGAIWDTKHHVIPIQYWHDPVSRRRRKIHSSTSDLGWLNFAGRWGNKGEGDCAWKRFDLPCQLGSGPP
jgi:hypothetical protein